MAGHCLIGGLVVIACMSLRLLEDAEASCSPLVRLDNMHQGYTGMRYKFDSKMRT